MTKYKYVDLDGEHIISDKDIIHQYFWYWSKKMKERNKEHLISYERCIEDFCTVHWAFKL